MWQIICSLVVVVDHYVFKWFMAMVLIFDQNHRWTKAEWCSGEGDGLKIFSVKVQLGAHVQVHRFIDIFYNFTSGKLYDDD